MTVKVELDQKARNALKRFKQSFNLPLGVKFSDSAAVRALVVDQLLHEGFLSEEDLACLR